MQRRLRSSIAVVFEGDDNGVDIENVHSKTIWNVMSIAK
jgi:hypothetical protein